MLCVHRGAMLFKAQNSSDIAPHTQQTIPSPSLSTPARQTGLLRHCCSAERVVVTLLAAALLLPL